MDTKRSIERCFRVGDGNGTYQNIIRKMKVLRSRGVRKAAARLGSSSSCSSWEKSFVASCYKIYTFSCNMNTLWSNSRHKFICLHVFSMKMSSGGVKYVKSFASSWERTTVKTKSLRAIWFQRDFILKFTS